MNEFETELFDEDWAEEGLAALCCDFEDFEFEHDWENDDLHDLE